MATQIPLKVLKDGVNTCGLAEFSSTDSLAVSVGGTGLTTQGICEFVQPGIQAIACKTTYLGICSGKSETEAANNTYVGYAAGQNVTTGCNHTLIGANAGDGITECCGTVAIGYNAGTALTIGMYNTLIGTEAGEAVVTANGITAIGYTAAKATVCSNNTAVGRYAMLQNTEGQFNTVIGDSAGYSMVAAGCHNTFVGFKAGCVNLCRDNTLIGAEAGRSTTTAVCNVMIGSCVGYSVTSGSGNVYIGDKAGVANTSGNDNVFIGHIAGCATTGSCCLIIGNGACDLITGSFGSGIVSVIGCVGIGTTTAAAELVIARTNGNPSLWLYRPDATIESGNALGDIEWVGDVDGACDIVGRIRTVASSAWATDDQPTDMTFETTADGGNTIAEKMRITQAGYVGIGTTAPSSILHIQDNAAGPTLTIEDTGNNTATIILDGDRASENQETGKIFFEWNGNQIAKVTGLAGPDTTNKDDGKLSFQTAAAGGSMTTAMTITHEQNVGIGTTSPDRLLTVKGALGLETTDSTNDWVVYAHTDDTLRFNFNGAGNDEVTIDCAGNVGIGVASPNCLFDVGGKFAVNSSGAAYWGDARDYGVLTWDTGKAIVAGLSGKCLVLQSASTDAITIDTSQNVGIGTTAPTCNLEIYGSNASGALTLRFKRSNSTTASGIIDFVGSGDAVGYSIGYNQVTGEGFEFNEDGDTTRMFIKDGGNVGIGTTAPGTNLHVVASGSAQAVAAAGMMITNSAAAACNVGLSLASGTTGKAYIFLGDSNDDAAAQIWYDNNTDDLEFNAGEAAGQLVFKTASTERVRVAADGVGIGTTDPDGNLHIFASSVGAVDITGYLGTNLLIEGQGNPGLAILTCDDGYGQMVWYTASGSGGTCASLARIAAGYNGGAPRLDFSVGASNNMVTLTCDGTVGLGTAVPGGIIEARTYTAGRYIFNGSNHASTSNGEIFIRGCGTGNNHNYYQVQNDAGCGAVFGIAGSGATTVGANLGYIYMNQYGCVMTFHPTTGAVYVGGALSKASGSFRIKHPLESKKDTHELVHSFTESPQADLLYSGWTQLTSGTATIDIDTVHDMTAGTFVALNRCIRVFTSNESDWDMVRGSVTGNQLTIESNNSSSVACVSWLVIGERCDKHMFDTDWTDEGGRVIVEPLADMTVGDIPDDPESVHSVNKTE